MRKPQGQRSLCALPPRPSASVLSGNRPLQIPQEGVKPLVANVGSRTSPGGSQGNCPPAQTPCSAPQLRSSCSQHHPQSSLQTRKTHPPSGPGFVGVFPLGYFYLLDKKVESTVLFVSSSNTTQVNPERRVFNYLCLVTRCSEKFQSSSFYFIQNHPS